MRYLLELDPDLWRGLLGLAADRESDVGDILRGFIRRELKQVVRAPVESPDRGYSARARGWADQVLLLLAGAPGQEISAVQTHLGCSRASARGVVDLLLRDKLVRVEKVYQARGGPRHCYVLNTPVVPANPVE